MEKHSRVECGGVKGVAVAQRGGRGWPNVDLLLSTTPRLWVMLLRDPQVYPVSPLSAPNQEEKLFPGW